MKKSNRILSTKKKEKSEMPFYSVRIPAGFPTPASGTDFDPDKIDLNRYLVKHPAATFFVRVKGHSMEGCGISDGDLLIVDRAIKPYDSAIVVALLDAEFTVKRIRLTKGQLYLTPENSNYKPIRVTKEMNFEVWGVVSHVIKEFK